MLFKLYFGALQYGPIILIGGAVLLSGALLVETIWLNIMSRGKAKY